MSPAEKGSTVQVHYTGKLEDGTVFDTSQGGEPLQFTVGAGEVIPGFEEAVVGMDAGEQKTFTIPAQEAYGPHRDDMVLKVGQNQIGEDIEPEVGQRLQVQGDNGQTFVVTVTNIGEDAVTLDANHPLAGEDLTFDVEVVGLE